jgi:hypothetical protein
MPGVYRLTNLGRKTSEDIQRIDTRSDAIMSYLKENGESTLEELENRINGPAQSMMNFLKERRQVEEI